ncbi:MAG: SLC13 family permease [Pirellulaceae bacterium]
MDLAWLSVVALVITVITSCFARVNPGVLAIVFAWLIASGIAPWYGEAIPLKAVVAGFPADLFLTLCGVTLLFSQARVNGTLDRVARFAVRCCQGRAAMIPWAFFVLTAALSAFGAGSIATTALIAPMAMAAATRARVPAMLMVLMVGHGAVAGGMSPFSLTGVVAYGQLDRLQLGGHSWLLFGHNFAVNVLVAAVGYAAFGGWRGSVTAAAGDTVGTGVAVRPPAPVPNGASEELPWGRVHVGTLAVVSALIVAVMGANVPVGFAAFVGAAILTLARAADEAEAIRGIPWPVLLMVCGVTMLTALIERTGGIERIAELIAAVSTPRTVPGVLAGATGLISVYSSTSGVVLPAFLPTIPALVSQLGGGDPLGLACSIIIGSNLVDVSPLSTIGALCIASAGAGEDRRMLFHKVLAWGLSMSLLAALFCLAVFGRS